MDPQAFIRLSIGSLGLRLLQTPLTSPCVCEIRLHGFPIQTTPIPLISSSELNLDSHSIASSFYLQESDLKALLAPRCFYASSVCLEIAIFTGRKETHCGGVGGKRRQIGKFKLDVGPEWGEGKPAVLFNGWIGISKNGGKKIGAELHLRVKLDPDPRYVFRFEDETKLSPQIVQLQGTRRQPIFSCKFSQDRVSQGDPLGTFWSDPVDGSHTDADRRERKGWRVKIHDLSGSAIAAAFITTPFVPSAGCHWVAKSNPGAWLIVHPDPYRPHSWQPWGKLEAWREKGGSPPARREDFVFFRFHLLSDGEKEFLMSEISINAEKGGEFLIDTYRAGVGVGVEGPPEVAGFVMSCRVRGEGKCSKPVVQLAMRHVTCVEDAAIFMALAAAVDLSVEACRTFSQKISRRGKLYSW